MNSYAGTALAYAIEFQQWPIARLLILRGADRVSPCSRGGERTPLDLALRMNGAGAVPADILSLLRDGPASPPVVPPDDQPPSKRQKLSKDGGDGMPHADFSTFGKSVRKLWAEYTDTLRLRSQTNPHWFGKGPQNRANRNYFHRKCVFYREIAREYELNASCIEAALTVVQAFVDPYLEPGRGGWKAAELKLRERTPAEGVEASRLDAVVVCEAL